MITTTRIEATDLEKLRELAKAHRRSMTQELGVLIATSGWIGPDSVKSVAWKDLQFPEIEYDKPGKRFGEAVIINPSELEVSRGNTELLRTRSAKGFVAKPQAKFGVGKPLPNGKTK